MGDLNAKVGQEQDNEVTGGAGLGIVNERGEMLIDWARHNNFIIGNTWFKQRPSRLWTWISPDKKVKNQIDYVMITKRFRNSLLNVKTRPGADCNSNHVPVVGKLRVRLKKLHRVNVRTDRLDLDLLKRDAAIREQYQKIIQFKYCAIEKIETVEEQWSMLKESIQQTSREIIPTKKRQAKQKWMT